MRHILALIIVAALSMPATSALGMAALAPSRAPAITDDASPPTAPASEDTSVEVTDPRGDAYEEI